MGPRVCGGARDGAWAIQDRFGFSWWDSLIVAAAQISACDVLLSEHFTHGLDVGGVVVLDPFRAAPDEVLFG